MSSQLDFIMQLYMMNLLQQQQQQQQSSQQQFQDQLQQQQQQMQQPFSPTKQKNDIATKTTIIAPAESTATTTTTTMPAKLNTRTETAIDNLYQQVEELEQERQGVCKKELPEEEEEEKPFINTRSKRSDNAQNTNCSSSSSCSPNSNSSCNSVYNNHTNNNTNNMLQQLLLNKLSPIKNLVTQPSTPTPTPTTTILTPTNLLAPSHVLLTPTTPNTINALTTATAASLALQQLNDLFNLKGANGLSSSNNTNNTNNNNNNNNNTNTNNFSLLQNFSTFSSHFQQNQFSAEQFLQSSTVTSTPTDKNSIFSEPTLSTTTTKQVEAIANIDNEEEDEDEKPLSSLYNSSGNASTSTGSGETTTSKLLLSGLQTLETTTDSQESLNAPFTPNKQAADSSLTTMSLFKDSPLLTRFSYDNEDSNIATPLLHAKALPTPPSSEQLSMNKTFESQTSSTQSSSSTYASQNNLLNAPTIFGSDALLTNEENLKNLRKVSSYLECENSLCRQENLREHFHCHEEPCRGKILSKKDDIIRHLKWHKKRKESYQLGFARFTSSDDCTPEYGTGCSFNWKQTHYHCIYEDCPKVYVSTSDVQMHANFHRKNTEIVQEGFRRFRAHENCKIEDCPFYGKRISHYHCCREGCNHTFKNKADMEKHKSYHLKDYQLTQDGFKKILKTEQCPFDACKYSTVCNHIHCVRENCNYILHSSSQMISHKRKHDRLDSEQAYQHFKKEKDSSEEESITAIAANASTPLSSMSAEHFLSRKRGRPPKKIQMPATSDYDAKRLKVESNAEQQLIGQNLFHNLPSGSFIPPFLSNFNAAAQTMPISDPNAPNFQLTHLMALFQLQNPLFYQNLYPGSAVANMANILNAAATAGNRPTDQTIFPHAYSGAFSTAPNGGQSTVKAETTATTTTTTTTTIKPEYAEKPQFNE